MAGPVYNREGRTAFGTERGIGSVAIDAGLGHASVLELRDQAGNAHYLWYNGINVRISSTYPTDYVNDGTAVGP